MKEAFEYLSSEFEQSNQLSNKVALNELKDLLIERYANPFERDGVIAYIYTRHGGLFHNIRAKFHDVDSETKESLILFSIHEGLTDFLISENTRKYSLTTVLIKKVFQNLAMHIRPNKNLKSKPEMPTISLDAPLVSTDGGVTVADMVADKSSDIDLTEALMDLNEKIKIVKFTNTEKKALKIMIKNQGLTQMEMKEMLGVSQAQVSRCQISVKRKLGLIS